MLIAEFTRATGLGRDTVRFYIKRGLLQPQVGNGSGNRYQHFDAAQVERALIIRNAQALGFSLKEIAALDAEFQNGGMSSERQLQLMRERLALINEQIAKQRQMQRYFQKKIAWLEGGERGPVPVFTPAAQRLKRGGC
jgi:MerR family copper efflux transcriptional regulator